MALTSDEMRDFLLKNGYTDETLPKKKSELRELYKTTSESLNVLETVEFVPEATVETEKKDEVKITDFEWTEHILSKLDKSEMDNGMPKVDGLRRLAHLVFGPFSSTTRVEQVPDISNSFRATVVVDLEFLGYDTLGLKVSGAADVFSGNTDRAFAKHPVATAESRAEGRALRKALKLTKVLTAEEMRGAEKDEPDGTDNRIATSMLNGLKLMSDRLGVDLHKVSLKLGFNIATTEDLTTDQGLEISNQLSSYQKDKNLITDEVK